MPMMTPPDQETRDDLAVTPIAAPTVPGTAIAVRSESDPREVAMMAPPLTPEEAQRRVKVLSTAIKKLHQHVMVTDSNNP
jgi:hypothetical protein